MQQLLADMAAPHRHHRYTHSGVLQLVKLASLQVLMYHSQEGYIPTIKYISVIIHLLVFGGLCPDSEWYSVAHSR